MQQSGNIARCNAPKTCAHTDDMKDRLHWGEPEDLRRLGCCGFAKRTAHNARTSTDRFLQDKQRCSCFMETSSYTSMYQMPHAEIHVWFCV